MKTAEKGMVAFKMRPEFYAQMEAAIEAMGYSDRSQFIRDAVWKYLNDNGYPVPPLLKMAPSRKGKGGAPTHKRR